MHHRLLSVQHAACGQQRGAHTQTGHFAAVAMMRRQPVDQLAVGLHHVGHGAQQWRRNADIDVRRISQHQIGLHLDAPLIQADLARERQGAHMELGFAPLRGQVVIGHQEAVARGFQGRNVGARGQKKRDVFHDAKHTPAR
ncbi:hypothetical protein D3C87_1465060 [compost metagenome]